MNLKFFSFILLLLLFSSCNKDDELSNVNKTEVDYSSMTYEQVTAIKPSTEKVSKEVLEELVETIFENEYDVRPETTYKILSAVRQLHNDDLNDFFTIFRNEKLKNDEEKGKDVTTRKKIASIFTEHQQQIFLKAKRDYGKSFFRLNDLERQLILKEFGIIKEIRKIYNENNDTNRESSLQNCTIVFFCSSVVTPRALTFSSTPGRILSATDQFCTRNGPIMSDPNCDFNYQFDENVANRDPNFYSNYTSTSNAIAMVLTTQFTAGLAYRVEYFGNVSANHLLVGQSAFFGTGLAAADLEEHLKIRRPNLVIIGGNEPAPYTPTSNGL